MVWEDAPDPRLLGREGSLAFARGSQNGLDFLRQTLLEASGEIQYKLDAWMTQTQSKKSSVKKVP